MKTKLSTLTLMLLLSGFKLLSQDKDTILKDEIIHIDKLERFIKNAEHVLVTFRTSYNDINDSRTGREGKFHLDEARIDFKGKVVDKLSFMSRYRLYRSGDRMWDGSGMGLDAAFLTYNVNDKLHLVFGKLWGAFGGIEWEPNPIRIYNYSDFLNGVNPFLTGFEIGYHYIKKHKIRLQVTNTANNHIDDYLKNRISSLKYDENKKDSILASNNLTPSIRPIGFNLNFVGDFNIIRENDLHYSVSYTNASQFETKRFHKILGGVKFNTPSWEIWIDIYYSKEDYDSKGYINGIYEKSKNITNKFMAFDVEYLTCLTKVRYSINKSFHLSGKVTYENSYLSNSNMLMRNSVWTHGILEYTPLKDNSLFFYTGYVGNTIKFNNSLGLDKIFNDRFVVGIQYIVPII